MRPVLQVLQVGRRKRDGVLARPRVLTGLHGDVVAVKARDAFPGMPVIAWTAAHGTYAGILREAIVTAAATRGAPRCSS